MPNTLTNLNVVITRPLQQSGPLKNAVSNHHGNPFLFPTLEIVASNKNNDLQKVIREINHYDYLFFTSTNAVTQVAPLLPALLQAKVVAIGPSTAAALSVYQVPVHFIPAKKYDSETLLASTDLKDVAGKNILIFSGEGGRSYLEDGLRLKKAIPTKVEVYCRRLPIVSTKSVSAIAHLENCIIVSTSCESLQNLIHIMQPHFYRQWLYNTPILLISERMRQFALTQGLSENLLVLADNATDQAILECLIKWYTQ